MANICFICDHSLSHGDTVVVERGLQTLKDASVNRGDGHIGYLKNVNTVTIHVHCRKDYIRKSSIMAFKRRRDEATLRALLETIIKAAEARRRINILVLLIERNPPDTQINFLKPGKGKLETRIYIHLLALEIIPTIRSAYFYMQSLEVIQQLR
ncbi:hypothetical protein PR048_017253 [Dryococelus australis]|uniref:Uncharacterized protein n=1 Tax=Dryococelus australis TaxID=614101 RepID=A0ABQ9H902_9NEOP|nr:hypothetical protein PR048_017253 [Dryococelus australis]